MNNIRAATLAEATRSSAEWVFVDLGFSSKGKSCGLLSGEGEARVVSFSELNAELSTICCAGHGPLNLLLEAPLSVAFGPSGNPTGRSIERRNGLSRNWYEGSGSTVLVAATYLLRSIHDLPPRRDIRLFEGLVSFKPKGVPSSHRADVKALRELLWSGNPLLGRLVAPHELASGPGDRIVSAFRVSGMDFGIPPVVVVGGNPASKQQNAAGDPKQPQVAKLVELLERHSQRATYGAVAGVLGASARSIMEGQPMTPANSFVVSNMNGEPTGYPRNKWHPQLKTHPEVIDSTKELEAWLKAGGWTRPSTG